jgi:adenine phosphoribosyltransferase
MSDKSLEQIKKELRTRLRQFPDFPTPGVLFEDIMPIFQSPEAFQMLLDGFKLRLESLGKKVDVIVGLDARGFLFGPALALQVGAAFVPVRKKGKLPGDTIEVEYVKEYGKDVFAIQAGSIKEGQTVVIVDDIIATGGSATAAGELVTKSGGDVLEFFFILELLFLKGRDKLNAPVFTLLDGQE